MSDSLLPIDPGAKRAILQAVEGLQARSTETLSRLVRHPSLLGDEASCLADMAEIYGELGLSPRRVGVDPAALADHPGLSPPLIPYAAGRDNVVAIHTPRERLGRSLMLQGHIDVVPVGAADLWTTPPFEPSVRDGRLYGRGACDMKAGVVSYLMAYAALREAGFQPAAELQMAAVIEEECTGNGALAVMQALPKPDACLIPEPGQRLLTAEVGVVWAWVTVTGKPVHVSQKLSGINAIEAAYIVSEAFRAYEARMNEADRRHPAYAGHNHPINVNFGTIEGGEWNSSVATRARIGMRVGVMPGYSCRDTKADIEALVAKVAADPRLAGTTVDVQFRGFMADGAIFPASQSISQAISACHRDLTGETLQPTAMHALTDARFYTLYQGTEATCYGPEGENIHGIDEWVDLASVTDVTKALALLIAGWCGLEKVSG
ncbi:ArgE/DapE family deacylase [Acidisoma cellulosilytica]|uniref:ArgE/DapE family deacylase n=1 Tax=Acidisoma cellulosilyticum TaxID=2802395 RepID=A0A963YYM7_9PROT|nr:ArgE/DapE family deacylase [Acidisoma cellulosilyticum]MCB8879576.1 ArgE/DapE family deacylase [Acidisoma cellulosilyticum]